MEFANRRQAGQLLARQLQGLVPRTAIIYALPRGGVPVAVEVALALDLPLDLVIPRKIGHPDNREYAIGAVTESGNTVFNPAAVAALDPAWLRERVEEERREAQRRRALYCAGRPRKSAHQHCAVIVDDGIATGLTMEAAVKEVKADQPASIVVAVAVAPSDTAEHFESLVDRFVAVHIPAYYEGAVGAYYADFRQTTDDDVLHELRRLRAPRATIS